MEIIAICVNLICFTLLIFLYKFLFVLPNMDISGFVCAVTTSYMLWILLCNLVPRPKFCVGSIGSETPNNRARDMYII